MLSEIIQLRKTLHQNPELSGQEKNTADRIKQFVKQHNAPSSIIENIGGAGLAVIYDSKNPGPNVMIRCELDALPIEETNAFDYKSLIKGVAHKCGHDGHMSIVAGLIFEIKTKPIAKGRLILLFQPAEETGQGAKAMLVDPKFLSLKPDFIFALHNIPGEASKDIILVNDFFSPAVISFAAHFKGKKSHASEPENGINPALALSEAIKACEDLIVEDPYNPDFALLTPIHINMGQKAYGISAGAGSLHYTIRTWSDSNLEQLKSAIELKFQTICSTHNLELNMNWFEHFPSTKNDAECNSILQQAATKLQLRLITKPFPFKFGEDFGWFSKKYKTCMFGLGAGLESPALHHADYDFNDELIPTGIQLFNKMIRTCLEK